MDVSYTEEGSSVLHVEEPHSFLYFTHNSVGSPGPLAILTDELCSPETTSPYPRPTHTLCVPHGNFPHGLNPCLGLLASWVPTGLDFPKGRGCGLSTVVSSRRSPHLVCGNVSNKYRIVPSLVKTREFGTWQGQGRGLLTGVLPPGVKEEAENHPKQTHND